MKITPAIFNGFQGSKEAKISPPSAGFVSPHISNDYVSLGLVKPKEVKSPNILNRPIDYNTARMVLSCRVLNELVLRNGPRKQLDEWLPSPHRYRPESATRFSI